MSKLRIGVLCPSEIAFRRFMPALSKTDCFEFAGIASANASEWFGKTSDKLVFEEKEKAKKFIDTYGGKQFSSYNDLLSSSDIDAVYIPLPPALHFKWAKSALESGKHILLEKPFTTSLKNTEELISIAKMKNLAVHENYMFVYHSQLEWIKNKIGSGEIGDIRLIRIDFGFPFRGANDFRYKKELGGGALLDCGGYTLKLASILLGETARITDSRFNYKNGFEVDIYGSATMINNSGVTAQISFGMDNNYRCNLDIWGSDGEIFTNRILTAPDGFEPTVVIKHGNEEKSFVLPADDTFKKSIESFSECILDDQIRTECCKKIYQQSKLVEVFVQNA